MNVLLRRGGRQLIALKACSRCTRLIASDVRNRANAVYEQGQSPKRGLREYFYYVDHQGQARFGGFGSVSLRMSLLQLFLDDARMKNFTSCFKDKEFLVFFYKRIRYNDLARYDDEFPFVRWAGFVAELFT